MNTTSIVRVQPADALPRVQSATPQRLTRRGNTETLCEMTLIAVAMSMATFLSYVFYHALQNYRVM